MSDFPENIFIGRDDDICVLEIEEDADFIEVYDSYQQYIRADLVPQWQPIETAPKDGAQILVEVMKGYYQVVSFRDGQWRENTNSMALRKPFLRWVTIPKMPE